MSNDLPRVHSTRRSGRDSFHAGGRTSGFDLDGFWSWSSSDLLSNATRGVLAEYIVGQAIGAIADDGVRTEWDAYDLVTPAEIKVEVKSSAFVQSWAQKRLSRPVFSIRNARSWDAATGETTAEPGRAADVYVFALLAHRDQSTIDPLDLDQWEFYVISTRVLIERYGSQKTLSFASLRSQCDPTPFDELAAEVTKAAVTPRA